MYLSLFLVIFLLISSAYAQSRDQLADLKKGLESKRSLCIENVENRIKDQFGTCPFGGKCLTNRNNRRDELLNICNEVYEIELENIKKNASSSGSTPKTDLKSDIELNRRTCISSVRHKLRQQFATGTCLSKQCITDRESKRDELLHLCNEIYEIELEQIEKRGLCIENAEHRIKEQFGTCSSGSQCLTDRKNRKDELFNLCNEIYEMELEHNLEALREAQHNPPMLAPVPAPPSVPTLALIPEIPKNFTEPFRNIFIENNCNQIVNLVDMDFSIKNGLIKNIKKSPQERFLKEARNQGNTGYCYAYTAADMLDAWLKSKNALPKGQQVSALALSLAHDEEAWKQYYDSFHDLSPESHTNPFSQDANSRIPSGGNVDNAIKSTWPKICTEYEVFSRDMHLHVIVQEHAQFFSDVKDTPLFPDNMVSALKYLGSSQHFDSDIDGTFLIAKALFPGLSFKSAREFYNFLKHFGVPGNIFNDILEKSCQKTIYRAPEPEIKKINLFYGHTQSPPPIGKKRSSEVFSFIDEGLATGKVVSISYHEDVFNHETPFYYSPHASLIIGSTDVCGKPYYILRNSYGKESCKSHSFTFESNANKNDLYNKRRSLDDMYYSREKLRLEKNECKKQHDEQCDVSYNAMDDKIKKQRDEIESLQNRITNKDRGPQVELSMEEMMLKKPYFCDSDGNYIISKEHLSKGAYGATYIIN